MTMKKRTGRVYLSNLVTPESGAEPPVYPLTPGMLQRLSQKLLPLYKVVAQDPSFAGKWSLAVTELDLKRLERLLKTASPAIKNNHSLSVNGIGYTIAFPDGGKGKPEGKIQQAAGGIAITPGSSAEDVFEAQAHQAVAAAVYPLYRTLATDRTFAAALAESLRTEDVEAAAVLIRRKVKSKDLKSISIDAGGLDLRFHFRFSKYTYRNMLFRTERA
jgi:hypothetical protein